MYEVSLALSVLCFGLVVGYFSRQQSFNAFHPLTIYLAFHGLVFVFRPIVAYFLDFRGIYLLYQFTPSTSDKTIVILASTLGMLSFAFFSLQTGNVPMLFKHDRFAAAERARLLPSALWTIAICGAIGAYSLAVMWGRATTGTFDMVRDAATGTAINTTMNGYVVEAQLMLTTCCVLLGWLFRFRLIALLPLLAFIVFRAGTGGRGPFVTAAASLVLIYLYEHRRRFPGVKMIALAGAVLALFVLVGSDRGATIRSYLAGTEKVEIQTEELGLRALEGMDFANMEYFEFLVYAVPQRTGTYEYFASNLIIFTEPIPRVLWPGKPIGSPVQFFKLFDYGFPIGMTRSLPGEGWTQLGWVGVVLWCGLWGGALGALYRRFATGTQSSFAVLFYFSFISVFIIAFRDGMLSTILRQGMFFVAPVLLWWVISSYLGIPLAQDARSIAARNSRRQNAEINAGRPVVMPQAGTAPALRAATAARNGRWLPPAVRRRHERLRHKPEAGPS